MIYSAQLKRQNNSDSQITIYYHPCNQNTNNHFGPLKQEEIRKLTFVIVSKLFLANRPIPSCLFYLLPFELSSISLSLESLLYHLFLRQSSITVHVRRSTHLLFMISWCAFHSPEGFARRVGKSQVEVCERRGKSFIKYFKGPFIKCFEETRLIAISFTC